MNKNFLENYMVKEVQDLKKLMVLILTREHSDDMESDFQFFHEEDKQGPMDKEHLKWPSLRNGNLNNGSNSKNAKDQKDAKERKRLALGAENKKNLRNLSDSREELLLMKNKQQPVSDPHYEIAGLKSYEFLKKKLNLSEEEIKKYDKKGFDAYMKLKENKMKNDDVNPPITEDQLDFENMYPEDDEFSVGLPVYDMEEKAENIEFVIPKTMKRKKESVDKKFRNNFIGKKTQREDDKFEESEVDDASSFTISEDNNNAQNTHQKNSKVLQPSLVSNLEKRPPENIKV